MFDLDPDVYKIPDDIPSIPSDSDFEDDWDDVEMGCGDNFMEARSFSENIFERQKMPCWDCDMHAKVDESNEKLEITENDEPGVDEIDSTCYQQTNRPTTVKFDDKIIEIPSEEIDKNEEEEAEEFPPLSTEIREEEKKPSRNRKKKLKKQIKNAVSYREIVLKNIPETFSPKTLPQPANDRKGPIEFCQKLLKFINLKHFNDDKMVDAAKLEEFIRNEYSDLLDDEDLHILEKICGGDMGCFYIFNHIIGQKMNVRFGFTKTAEFSPSKQVIRSPTMSEVNGFLTLIGTRIEEIKMYIEQKAVSVSKFAAIANAIIWDTRLYCFSSMMEFIVGNQYAFYKLISRFGHLFNIDKTSQTYYFFPLDIKNLEFFELLREEVEKYYPEIPDQKEINIMEFDEIVEGVLGEFLTNKDRITMKDLINADEKAVTVFSRALSDYFQIGVKNGLVLIKKRNPPRRPVSNTCRSLFQLTRETVSHSFMQSSSIGYPSKSCLKSKFKNDRQNENENYELLHCATQTDIVSVHKLEKDKQIEKCVQLARNKIFEKYVRFDEREMRMVERFFKELTPELIFQMEEEVLENNNEKEKNLEIINNLKNDLESETKKKDDLQETLKLTNNQLIAAEDQIASNNETIEKLKKQLTESQKNCEYWKCEKDRLQTETIAIKKEKERLTKELESNTKIIEYLQKDKADLKKSNRKALDRFADSQRILAEKDEELKKYKKTVNELSSSNSPQKPEQVLSPKASISQEVLQLNLKSFQNELKYFEERSVNVTKDVELLMNSKNIKDCLKKQAEFQYRKYIETIDSYSEILRHNIQVCEGKIAKSEMKKVPGYKLEPFDAPLQEIIDRIKEENDNGVWKTVKNGKKKK